MPAGASFPPITVQLQAEPGDSSFSAVAFGGGAVPVEAVDTASVLQVGASPAITSVNTAGSTGSNIAQNDWIEIKGVNLVPSTTAANGVIWSNAPDFASGRMPTQLNGVSVTVNGQPAYVYFYCSAVTSQTCNSDQINVLTPLDGAAGSVTVVVTNGPTASAPFTATLNVISPSFLRYGGTGYVTATHADYSLLGPARLFPGSSTPAAPGEVVILWAVGFGLPTTPLTNGAAIQSGALPETPTCTVGGNPAPALASLVSPGLYQINLTIPVATPDGDSPIRCTYSGCSP